MADERSKRRVRVVITVTAMAAVATLAATTISMPWALPTGSALGALVLFSALYVLAEVHPIRAAGGAQFSEFTTSAAFAYALLLTVPLPLALAVMTVGSFVADRRPGSRRPWTRTIFNVSQVLLSFAVGGGLLHLFGATVVDGAELPDLVVLALLPSGLAMYITNLLLVGLVVAAAHDVPLRRVVSRDLEMYDLLSHFLLLGLAPVLVLVWSQNWLLTPLLLVAAFATYRSTQTAVAGQHASRHDPLTGLPNRRLFDERLAELTAVRDSGSFATMLMDFDRFKTINDVMGHHVGDQLLVAAAERLRGIAGIDTVARVGGDEFAFVVRLDDEEELERMGQTIVSAIDTPYEIQDVPLHVGASLGIARFPVHGHDAPSLMRRADSAMYLAKRTGSSLRFASPIVSADDEPADDPGRASLLGDVEAALAAGQFRLDHQPQIDLVSGRVVGVEALLRWEHPEHGSVPPSRFVPSIEHTELYSALTRHALRIALADQVMFAGAGFDLPVAVNISARDLLDMRLPRDIADLLTDAGVRPDRLTLEITENALVVDLERARQVVAELTDLGIGLALDDFGTGYASLGTLRDLPVAELKIDRTFVAALGCPSGSSIVRAIIGLAHDLSLHVVAEGIETGLQLEELRSFGCDIAQGYLLSRPLDRLRLVGWLRERQMGIAATPADFPVAHHLQKAAG